MKRFLLPLLVMVLLGASGMAQTDPTVIEINGKAITKSEFKKEFLKSIGQRPEATPTACTYEKRKALEDYVTLYTNFQAKLEDAFAMKIDTLRPIKKELMGYRNELAAPYLIDSVSLNRIYEEAYERNKYALHAAHVLIRVDRNAVPADTLVAYNKAMEVYNKAMAGEDFTALAVQYSDDPSAKGVLGESIERKGNGGDLGCFTVFSMVYPFESAAYALKVGEISKPVRTDFGYHIIKLIDKIDYFGRSTIQHIWINANKGVVAESMARNAYAELLEGNEFAKVARAYSSDGAESGGFIPDIEMHQMPAEYVLHLSKLQPGEFSEPFKTQLGWHIVRLVKKEQIPTLEDLLPSYRQRLTRDPRNKAPKEAFAAQCKEKYGFTDYTQQYVKKGKKKEVMATLDAAIATMNDSVYRKKWHYREGSVSDMRPLCKIGEKEYNTVDFLKWIEANQEMIRLKGDYTVYLNKRYKEFTNDMALAYCDSRLELEHPEFAELIRDYKHGLMIFSYNDKMVWSKAIKDTVGLKEFYDRESKKRSLDNPEDDPYFWGSRAHMIEVRVADSALLAPKKAMKIIEKYRAKGIDQNEWKTAMIKACKDSKDTNVVPVTVVTRLMEEGSQKVLSANEWKVGTYVHPETKGYSIVVVDEILDPMLKSVKEARGYYINDYQNYLDQELIKNLREKYNVKVYQNVVDEITY